MLTARPHPFAAGTDGHTRGNTNPHKADIHLLGRVTSGKVTPDVEVVVLDDTSDDVGGGDAFGSLSGYESSGVG